MHGCTDRVWLVFNGEIYNHARLRAELEQRGHHYASRTDSETILHLYEELGLDFVNDLEGDYAIAIWDADREQLVLVRDRAGVKPLYFYHHRARFMFASEIKAILQHPEVTAELNQEALYHYLTFVTTPALDPNNRTESLYVAIAMLGATVMPHNLYLHSALVQTRAFPQTPEGKALACKYNFFD